MRVLVKIFLIGLGLTVLVVSSGLIWVFFYSRDLPDVEGLAQFAPAHVTHVSDSCLKSASIAIPYDSIGDNLRAALRAAEASEQDPGVLAEVYRGFTDRGIPGRVPLSFQVARSMFCEPSKGLKRREQEIRMASQLEKRFSRRELFTIYANRIWFGNDLVGVQAASQAFFEKDSNELRVADAALLAGLARAPSRLSPLEHPDRALQRRNEVIDAMVEAHAISVQEGDTSKASALGIVTR